MSEVGKGKTIVMIITEM